MQQHAETMFFGQGDHLIQANPSNEFYALLFRETKTSNADDAAVFLASFTSTESSCVKNLRHDFLKLSMEMVGYPLKWNMSWYLRHYFLKWCSTRYPLKVSETSHLVDVTGMMISKDNHPHMALLQLFSVLWIVTIQPGLRLAQVPTEGTYKKEQMRVM